jgi:hypothetical protein
MAEKSKLSQWKAVANACQAVGKGLTKTAGTMLTYVSDINQRFIGKTKAGT